MLYIIEVPHSGKPDVWRVADKEKFIDMTREVSEYFGYNVHDYDSAVYALEHDLSSAFILDGDDEAREFLAANYRFFGDDDAREKLRVLMS